MRDEGRFYINGEWVRPAGHRQIINVENPATETVAGQVLQATREDVDQAVAAARAAFQDYSQWSRQERLRLLDRIIADYKARAHELASVMTEEMGASRRTAVEQQVPAGLKHLESAYHALKLFPFKMTTSADNRVVREPIGVCALITPWNWPMNQIAAKVAPVLATGCTCVLKPSEVAPLSAHIFAEILHEAGVPAGVFNLVDGTGSEVGAYMAGHPGVDMVSFTGSTRAGVDVSHKAAPTIKRVTLELGGKSPNIILDDADLESAVRAGTHLCMNNVGQSCDAPSRMLVPNSRMVEAIRIAKEAAAEVTTGDPTSDVDNGPIAYRGQYDKIVSLIQKGIEEGCELVYGGAERPPGLARGWFVQPTVFARVCNDAAIAREEIFGPVLSVIGYEDEEEAIRIANDTPYGLAAYVQSASVERARKVASRLQAGYIEINYPAGDPEAPFGGYKQSGNGREGGAAGFESFLEIKSIIG
ncbi:MAG: aldehyde dehydrogenase family protein [Chloroflexota bacterium]